MPKLTPAQMKAAVEEFKKKFTPGYYHGSPSPNIKAFDSSKAKDPDLATPGVTFVTRDPDFAESFLPGTGKSTYKSGATMYPVSVNLGKHWDPNTAEGKAAIKHYIETTARKNPSEGLLRRGDWTETEHPDFLDYLRKQGYDTFYVAEGGTPNVGVFNPKNIRGKFAKFNPEDAESPEFMKAAGGAIKSGLAALKRHPHGQDPKVAKALEEYLKGNISQEERLRILNQQLPIRKWSELPPDYTDEQIINALMANKQAKALVPVAPGARVGNRLDIPAYTQHGVYVDTTHDIAGKPISYGRTGHLKDVEFSSKPNQAVRVGLGTKEQALTPMGAEMGAAKSPFALIKGTNVGTKDEEVRRMMAELLNDPSYTQIGMDPRRHSQFYDKETGLPVWRAGEKLQSGPLILAPRKDLEITDWNDPRLELTDFPGKRYAAGGAAKKALEHARKLPFVHFSRSPSIAQLEPRMYGTGIKGQEASRLTDAPDIKPRSYFYVDKPNVRPEQGLGPHKYQGVAEDIYPLHDDPLGLSAIAKQKSLDPYLMSQGIQQVNEAQHLNELERLIKQAGYKGYANEDVGLLFYPTPVQKAVEGKAGGGKIGALESLAKKILPAAEREANKAKFLEGTKVVDQNGKPITMYHHTKDFQGEAFDPALAQAHDAGYHGKGMYFGSKDYLNRSAYGKHSSGNVAGQTGFEEGSQVIPVNLAIKNPKYVDVTDQSLYGMPIEKLKQQGYDGVIVTKDASFKNAMGRVVPRKEVYNAVAFEPTQIKSTIGNTGTYDPLDPSLVKKKGGSV